MPWQGTRCPLAAGWQQRLASKVLLAAGLGSAAGAVLAILERKPMLPHIRRTASSAAICLGFFGVLQEGMRIVRCHDSSINSIVAGGAASYILVSLQSGRQKAVPAALYCSLGAGGLHWLSQWYDWGTFTRRMLVRVDLLDDEEVKREIDRPKLPYSPGRKEDLGWRRHLPIRKLTEEEWKDYQRVRKQRFKDRVKAAQAGGIAGILEGQQDAENSVGEAADGQQQR
ncbi:g1136 [Coccomyxa elongata]